MIQVAGSMPFRKLDHFFVLENPKKITSSNFAFKFRILGNSL